MLNFYIIFRQVVELECTTYKRGGESVVYAIPLLTKISLIMTCVAPISAKKPFNNFCISSVKISNFQLCP